jgi:hypothetical protein
LAQFSDLARCEFDPIGEKFGLVFAFGDESRVTYCNKVVELNILCDFYRSKDVWIGLRWCRQSPNEPFYTLNDISRLRGGVEVPQINATDLETTRVALKLLANLTLKYAPDFLRGDSSAFEELASFNAQASIDYTRDLNIRAARAKSVLAWSSKNYAAVVESLSFIGEGLSNEERGRLEFARAKLKSR